MAKRTRVPVRVRRVPSAYEIMRDPYGRSLIRPQQGARSPGQGSDREGGDPWGSGRPPEASQNAAARPEASATAAAGGARAPEAEPLDEVRATERREEAAPQPARGGAREKEPAGTASSATAEGETVESVAEWRDRALRLQAEIENFRKRQQRLSQERIRDDRERLLRAFLSIADDLERALGTEGSGGASVDRLREGVELTHRGLLTLLQREGVEPIEALGVPFDPVLHDGIATVPHQQAGIEPNTVAKVVETGYRMGDRLLRPARVIVAD